MTHTEYTHIFFGFFTAFTGAVALYSIRHPTSGARFVWPVLIFLLGLFLFIPTETQERTYSPVGPWETFLSAFPTSLDVWLESLKKFHVIQHKAGGFMAMMLGTIEFGRAKGWLTKPMWQRWFPPLAVGVGLSLAIHGGSQAHLPHAAEQAHHWILGLSFAGGGLALGLAQAGVLRQPMWRWLWALLMFIAGLNMALFYRV